MRLLVIAPHLAPDTAPTGVVVSALVAEMTAVGHQVHVVTSLPWYEKHAIDPDWKSKGWRQQGEFAGATVTRCYPFPAAKSNLLGRALGFIGFTALATLTSVFTRKRFDAVLAVSPPLTLGLAGWIAARRHRCPLIFNIQDVFPDVAIEVGALTSGPAIRFFKTLERFCYRRAQAVTVLSDDLAANVTAKVGPSGPPVVVIPNFVDTTAIAPQDRATNYRTEHELGERTVVMYAGNLGHSQSLNLMVEAARRHQNRSDVVYVINGDGVAAAELKTAAADLPNLTMVGYQSADRLSEVLASADLHLILLRKGLGASSVPSKMYSILAAGRPVVASIDPDSEVTRVLKEAQAGLSVPPDDLEAFVAAVELLLDAPPRRQEMGQAGRSWVKQWPTAPQIAKKYQELAEGLAKG